MSKKKSSSHSNHSNAVAASGAGGSSNATATTTTSMTMVDKNGDSTFVVDGIQLSPDLEAVTSRLGRHYRRRPDRHPFIVDVPSSMFFSTRSMPQSGTRYPMVVGESFWRLAAYIDSVPSRLEERIPGKPPHVMVRGMPGSGKSYLMAQASALLSYGPHSNRPKHMTYLSADYRTVYIGDCRRWLESDDPLTYFRMELLAGFRDDCVSLEDHHSPDHLGCLVCVEPFTRVDQVKQFLDRCCKWIPEYEPDSLLVFFIDQAEELSARPDSIPFQIVSYILAAKMPLVVFSVPTHHDFAFKSHCSSVIDVPYRVTATEFPKHVEVHGGLDDKTFAKDVSLWRDVRMWTGGIPQEIATFLAIPGTSTMQRLQTYRRKVSLEINAMTLGFSRLDGRQRNILLIVLFAIILRVPMDMSGEFNLPNILALGPSITNMFLLNCLQTFYHTSDGIVTMRDVPAAPSMAMHFAICGASFLNAIIRTWTSLFENVVHAMVHSKLLCAEAKRRMSRFYAHAKLLWGRPDWRFDGQTEMGESLSIKFKQARVVLFAGQTPALPLILTGVAGDGEHHGVAPTGDFDATVFLPGRTSYWFFDLFVFVPEDRRLYAITTSAVVGTWLKELQTRVGPMQLQQQKEDGLLTPIILLDNWREALRKAGYTKITIKTCVMKTMDLMLAAGYVPPPPGDAANAAASPASSAPPSPDNIADHLAKHLEASVSLNDD